LPNWLEDLKQLKQWKLFTALTTLRREIYNPKTFYKSYCATCTKLIM